MSNEHPSLPVGGALQPQSFSYQRQLVRCVGFAEKPEWVAADILAILYPDANPRNYRNYLAKIRDKWKGHKKIMTPGGIQEVTTLYEPGLFQLLARSSSIVAEPFQDWLYEEVLPSIRKTGRYEAPEQTVPVLKPYTDRVSLAYQIRACVPDDHWSIFLESAQLLINAEAIYIAAGLKMDQFDLLDGSVGLMYPKFREGKPWSGKRIRYVHKFPSGDRRGSVKAWAYPMIELPHFRTWLHKVYEKVHFADYLQRKYGPAAVAKALPVFRQRGIPLAMPLP